MGSVVAPAPAVRVIDSAGVPVPGALVQFAITAGAGSVSPQTQLSGPDGVATVSNWTLGPSAVANTLTATVPPLTLVVFTVRATVDSAMQDRPDEVAGPQVHIMYVLPSDATDRGLDVDGTLANSVGSFQTWLSGQTSGRRLRIDTFNGRPDLTFFRLRQQNSAMRAYGPYVRDHIEAELAAAGMLVMNKIYAVYYDGGSTYSCGGGAWPPTLDGQVAALYLQGTPPGAVSCNAISFATSPTAAPAYLEFAMLHELMHTLGFVDSSAPHFTLSGHVSDSNQDLMYAGPQPWWPSVLDVGQDDYYGANVPTGVLNFADSPYLMR